MTAERWNVIGAYAHAVNVGAVWGVALFALLLVGCKLVFGCFPSEF